MISKFELEIRRAKKETIEINRENWKNDWVKIYLKNNPDSGGVLLKAIPEPPLKEITPKSWFITEWGTGFICADLEKLMKLPKRARDKIFALGGI